MPYQEDPHPVLGETYTQFRERERRFGLFGWFFRWRDRARDAAINDYLAKMADEVITIKRDGSIERRTNLLE